MEVGDAIEGFLDMAGAGDDLEARDGGETAGQGASNAAVLVQNQEFQGLHGYRIGLLRARA